METEQILQQRATTHGDFTRNAMVSQRLKQIFRAECQGYEMMHVVYKEALDMIFLKLSRIASGQAEYKDHWDDIAGYAKLAANLTIHKPGDVTYVPPSR